MSQSIHKDYIIDFVHYSICLYQFFHNSKAVLNKAKERNKDYENEFLNKNIDNEINLEGANYSDNKEKFKNIKNICNIDLQIPDKKSILSALDKVKLLIEEAFKIGNDLNKLLTPYLCDYIIKSLNNITKLMKDLQEKEEELANLAAKYLLEEEQMKINYKTKEENFKNSFIKMMENEINKKINKLEEKHIKEMREESKKSNDEIKKLNEEWIKKLNEECQKSKEEIKKLNEECQKSKEEIKKLNEEHKEEIKKLNEEHKEEIKKLNEEHKEEIKKLNEEHKKEIKKINDENMELKIRVLFQIIKIYELNKHMQFVRKLNFDMFANEFTNKKNYDHYSKEIAKLKETNKGLLLQISDYNVKIIKLSIENDKLNSELAGLKVVAKTLFRLNGK